MGRHPAWMKLERKVAKALGGRRVATLGRRDHDIECEFFIPECKYGKQVPKAVEDWLNQAKSYKKPDKYGLCKIPLVVMKRPNAVGEMVLMDFDDFVETFGVQRAISEAEKAEQEKVG